MPKDYSESGLDLQYAFIAASEEGEHLARVPPTILWGGLTVQNSDHIDVPKKGRVTLRFLQNRTGDTRQGVDICVVDGALELVNRDRVGLLRTWSDDQLEATVAYNYMSSAAKIIVYNVYRMTYGGGQTVEEKFTGNAGLIVEKLSALHRRYRASPGFATPPDFDALSFEIEVQAK